MIESVMMTVRVKDIAVGRCYVTGSGTVRIVLEITADRHVRWEDHRILGKVAPETMSTMERFAIEVEHVRHQDL